MHSIDPRPGSLQTPGTPVVVGELVHALRERTRTLHAQAERSGIVHDILRGRVDRYGYALFLRNLLPAYEQLERGLERHALAPGISMIAQPALYRARALASDLQFLCGSAWSTILPLLASGERYARRVAAAAVDDKARLIAHAYVRYLGDLSGGQAMRRLLARALGLEHHGLSFYDFPDIGDHEIFKAAYLDSIDRAAHEITAVSAVVDEAAVAFELNIDVSKAVQEALK
jgi:heme oxygenase